MRRATIALLLLSGCAQGGPRFAPPPDTPPLNLDIAPEPPTWPEHATAERWMDDDGPAITGGRLICAIPKDAPTARASDTVLAALTWLARHQLPDGSWGAHSFVKRCSGRGCTPNPGNEDFDAGLTGLALLAFLGAGYSHRSKDTHDGVCFGDVVKKSLQWMMNHQDPEGCIGPRNASKYMYNHAICAQAVSEAFGRTGSMLFKDSAQKAVDFIIAAQNPGKAWRYGYKCGDNDTSVTGWAVAALRSAEISGLAFPKSAYDGARAWLDEVTEQNYYRVGYTHRDTGKLVIPGASEHFNHHETLTAMAIVSRLAMDRDPRDPRIVGGAMLLANDLPNWKDNDIDFYYWHWGTCALAMFTGPADRHWTAWGPRMKEILVENQKIAGCRAGSWEPVDRWSSEGGRVYATAINALTLQKLLGFGIEQPVARTPETARQAAPLIEALGADDLDERERAEAELVKLGRDVRPFLEDAAAQSDDAEIRARAQALLDKGEFRARLGRWMDANRADWEELLGKMRGGGPVEFHDESRPAGVAMASLKRMDRRAVYAKLVSFIDHEDVALGRAACAALSHLTGHKEPLPTEQNQAQIKARWQEWLEKR